MLCSLSNRQNPDLNSFEWCVFVAMTDAGGGGVRGAGAHHAGVPHARHVQAEHGRAGLVHVPAGVAGAGDAARAARPLPVAELPHQHVRVQLVPDAVHHSAVSTARLPADGCVSLRGHGDHLQGGAGHAPTRQG